MKTLAFYPLSMTHAIELLMDGAVGVLPTDTVYGIVARAEDKQAVARLYRMKHREGKPGTIVAANTKQLEVLGVDPYVLKRVSHLWPGAISVVLPDRPQLAYLDQGKASLAVRVTADEELAGLLEKTGPLLTTSVNMPGAPPAQTVTEAEAYFADAVDFYVDGGNLADREPSTVVRLKDGELEVLRQGAVSIKTKEQA